MKRQRKCLENNLDAVRDIYHHILYHHRRYDHHHIFETLHIKDEKSFIVVDIYTVLSLHPVETISNLNQ